MSEVTRILSAIEQGDSRAAGRLLPLVYDELRQLAAQRLAHEKPGQTLQATALVHEAYLRLVGDQGGRRWEGRGHFFAAAAESMRRILVENARRKGRLKRGGGGGGPRVDLETLALSLNDPPDERIALDEAMTKLAEEHPDKARLVNLRFFGGLTHEEAAQAIGVSVSTADRHWAFARAWLYRRMSGFAAVD